MKKSIAHTLLFIFSGLSFAHSAVIDSLKKKQKKYEIELSGDYFFNSTAVTNQFINTFHASKFIDNTTKDNVVKKLKYNNRFGTDVNTGITFTASPDSFMHRKNVSWSISMRDRQHTDGIFSRDFFKTVSYGNKIFAGQTADLSNLSIHKLHYQQLQLSFIFEGDSSSHSYGWGISLLNGQQWLNVDVDRADLFTSADGKYIDLELSANAHISDTANKKFPAHNGSGISFDGFYEIPFVTWNNVGVLSIEMFDLGFISWNKNSMSNHLDSNYHYQGIEIDNLFILGGTILPQYNKDSVSAKNIKLKKESDFSYTPAIFRVRTSTEYGKKFIFEKGISYRINANSRPYYFLGLTYKICRQFEITGNASYGGYGNFNFGLELDWSFLKYYKFHIDTNYLNGFISPAKITGQGAAVSLSRKF